MKKISGFCASLALVFVLSTPANSALIQTTIGDFGALSIGDTVIVERQSGDLITAFSGSITIPNTGDSFQDDYKFTLTDDGVSSAVNRSLEVSTTSGPIFSISSFKISIFEGDPDDMVADTLKSSVEAASLGDQITLVISSLVVSVQHFMSISGVSDGSGGGKYGGSFAITAMPIPPAAVLFLSALAGLAGFSRTRRGKAVARAAVRA